MSFEEAIDIFDAGRIKMDRQTQRICFFTTASLEDYGGGEKWLITIANELVTRGFSVLVFGTKNKTQKRKSLQELESNIKFKYEEIEAKGWFFPFMLKQLPQIKCDLIYVMGGYYFYIRQILKLNGKKVYGGHDPSLMKPKTFFKKRILKSLLPKFDKIHAINKEELMWSTYNKNTYVLENTYFGPVLSYEKKPDNFTVLYYGRHEKIKGTETVKYIINNLDPTLSIIIAGAGTESESLKYNKQNFLFLGFINEDVLYETIRKAHAVLFPSYTEVSPLVVYEVLGNYTPIIYRNRDFNSVLNNIELCRKADSDQEFLDQIYYLYTIFKTKRDYYDTMCSKLPSGIDSFENYIEKFIEIFIK